MIGDKVWVVPGLGLVHSTGEKKFSNSSFIETIRKDNSTMGNFMSTKFQSETEVSLSKNIPSSWVQWNVIDVKNIGLKVSSDFFPEEIPGCSRMMVPRGEQMKRQREMIPRMNMVFKGRGIRENNVPESVQDAFASIICGLYMIVEKNTIMSKKKEENAISKDRLQKIFSVYDIVAREKNIVDVFLVSCYTEPSATMLDRVFFLADIYGVDETKNMIDEYYYHYCEKQVDSLSEMLLSQN